jgi:hypothetical protein
MMAFRRSSASHWPSVFTSAWLSAQPMTPTLTHARSPQETHDGDEPGNAPFDPPGRWHRAASFDEQAFP